MKINKPSKNYLCKICDFATMHRIAFLSHNKKHAREKQKAKGVHEKYYAGRPAKFKTPLELQKKVIAYFASLKNDARDYIQPPTVTGLARHLDLSRKGLLDYQNKKGSAFGYTIEYAKQTIEAFLEGELFRSGSVRGVIFNLRNNFGWKQKKHVQRAFPIKHELTEEDKARVQRVIDMHLQ